jgi:hypothetical protein
LLAAMGAELLYERCGECEDQLRFAVARLDARAAGEVPAAAGPLRAFAAVANAAGRAWPFYLRAAVATGEAVSQAVGSVLVFRADARAGTPVAVGGAFGRVAAAVAVAGPRSLCSAGVVGLLRIVTARVEPTVRVLPT